MSAWIDSSDCTHLVLCTRCSYTIGPYFNRDNAMTARINHNADHRQEDERKRALTNYHKGRDQ